MDRGGRHEIEESIPVHILHHRLLPARDHERVLLDVARRGERVVLRDDAPGVFLDIGHGEERTPGMHPTRRFHDGPRRSPRHIKLAVSVIGVRLEDADVSGQMCLGVLPLSIA